MNGLNRRSMTAALRTGDLSPDMLAFVKAGTPPSGVALSPPPATSTEPVKPPPFPGPTAEPAEPKDRRSAATKWKPDHDRALAGPVHKVNLSVRVPAALTAGLLRASTDRKLNRERPATQQEIVTEAIEQWLKRHGYSGGETP